MGTRYTSANSLAVKISKSRTCRCSKLFLSASASFSLPVKLKAVLIKEEIASSGSTWVNAMEVVCRKACGHCDAPCVDKNANCPIYKKLNYCGNQKFKPWLQLNCGLSCGFRTAAPTAAPQPPPLPEGMGKF